MIAKATNIEKENLTMNCEIVCRLNEKFCRHTDWERKVNYRLTVQWVWFFNVFASMNNGLGSASFNVKSHSETYYFNFVHKNPTHTACRPTRTFPFHSPKKREKKLLARLHKLMFHEMLQTAQFMKNSFHFFCVPSTSFLFQCHNAECTNRKPNKELNPKVFPSSSRLRVHWNAK